MPRANRHFIPGYIWHITDRCHKKEFLLKYSLDKKQWLYWLWQAKRRFSLRILNYIVTSNHIHLLISDSEEHSIISDAMQLIAGRPAQEYNRRKKRIGSFWQDRYHATAIDSGYYFMKCMVYIDLNMVRAGVVSHPLNWLYSGYYDCYYPRQRYRIIDYDFLMKILNMSSIEELRHNRKKWIEESLQRKNELQRQEKWTNSIAVGSKEFSEKIKKELGYKASGRAVIEDDNIWTLRENLNAYSRIQGPKMANKEKKK